MKITLLFCIGVISIILSPIAYQLSPTNNLGIMVLCVGALLVVLSRFEDVTELSLLGLKAKLEKALIETTVALEEIKDLARIMSISSLSNTARSGWLGGLPTELKETILRDTIKALKKLKFSEEEIYSITKDYHDCVLATYCYFLIGNQSQILSSESAECNQEHKFLRNNVLPPVPPERIQKFFDDFMVIDAATQRRIDGYKYYFEKQAFLDREDFIAAQEREGRWPMLVLKPKVLK